VDVLEKAMRKVIDYKIICDNTNGIQQLEYYVAGMIKDGWEPVGGIIALERYRGQYEFYQTMVLYRALYKSELI
jgi:hypothetical protein